MTGLNWYKTRWKQPDIPLNQTPPAHMTTATTPTANPAPCHGLFCFGTLQIPTVLEAVIGRRLQGARAFLHGYIALQVCGAEYPGLHRAPGQKTPGRLYRDVTPQELDVLDRFEGPLYRRRYQFVSKNNGQRTQAWTYMMAAGRQNQLTKTPWHLDRFMRTEYPRFMRRFVRNRRFLYEPEDS